MRTIGDLPPTPMGNGADARFMRWVKDQLKALRILDSPGYRVNRSPNGQALLITPAPAAAPEQPGIQIKVLHFKQSFGDYFLTNEGTSVAKPPKLRNSVTSETIYGTIIAFGYPHNTAGDSLAYLYRTASIGGAGTENQGVVPQYLVNDTIYAIQATTNVVSSSSDKSQPTGTTITWLDLNIDGRAWSKFSNQSF